MSGPYSMAKYMERMRPKRNEPHYQRTFILNDGSCNSL